MGCKDENTFITETYAEPHVEFPLTANDHLASLHKRIIVRYNFNNLYTFTPPTACSKTRLSLKWVSSKSHFGFPAYIYIYLFEINVKVIMHCLP